MMALHSPHFCHYCIAYPSPLLSLQLQLPGDKFHSQASQEVEVRSKTGLTGKIKMVYDRLRGIERENLPLSRQQAVDDQETVAQQNVLSSVNGKTPKEHQIGE